VIVLIGFALLAGAGTAISPCVLPVLPALLSAGATGGRRRPLGVVVGLVATFTLTVVGVASVVHGVGLAGGFLRTFAILVLLGFGVSLIVPSLAARLEAPLSRLARFGPRSTGTGFWSGTVVGAAFGFVYAPCAGPILAAVISVSASRGTSLELVLIALAYGVGSGVVLLALTSGGRRLAERVRRAGRGPSLQRALGAVMVLTAVLMLAMVDVRFEQALAKHFPDVTPTAGLESSGAVDRRLAALRGHPKFDSGHPRAAQPAAPDAAPGTPRLPDLGAAPDFTGTQRWFNTPGGRPLTLAALRGRVVLVDFWTYTWLWGRVFAPISLGSMGAPGRTGGSVGLWANSGMIFTPPGSVSSRGTRSSNSTSSRSRSVSNSAHRPASTWPSARFRASAPLALLTWPRTSSTRPL
jgi:cytochrome c biogenesis protein CcdA